MRPLIAWHGLEVAGATEKLVADPALEVLYRVSRGNPRTTAHLLRASLMLAHDRDQPFRVKSRA